MKHRKIAFYIGSLDKGGAERVITNLAEYFFSKGYEVTMVTKMKEKEEYSHKMSESAKKHRAEAPPEYWE